MEKFRVWTKVLSLAEEFVGVAFDAESCDQLLFTCLMYGIPITASFGVILDQLLVRYQPMTKDRVKWCGG